MRNPIPRIHKPTPYKSELCLLFQKNKCYKGERCHFAHSINELSNRNGFFKTSLCYWSFNGKECPFGNKCRYLHKHEYMGVRNAGLPVLFKTKLCEKWERFGWCSYGVECIFAHGQQELDVHTKKPYLPELETRTSKLQRKGPSWLGWSLEKIGRIYGDWIDCMDEIQFPSS